MLARLFSSGRSGSRKGSSQFEDEDGSVKVQPLYSTVPKGTLHALLHGGSMRKVVAVDWSKIIGILLEVARGISRIHAESAFVTHHDRVKYSKSLLDNKCGVARLSEFGLALILYGDSPSKLPVKAQKLGITMPSKEYDIYLFGKLILETITQTRIDELPSSTLEIVLERFFNMDRINNSNYHADVPQTDQGAQVSLGRAGSGCSSFGVSDESRKEEMVKMLRLGLACQMIQVDEQPNMEEVVKEISTIKGGMIWG